MKTRADGWLVPENLTSASPELSAVRAVLFE
jgi:hypothetical protein